MEGKEFESCVLAGMLIACLGFYDFWRAGGGMHATMGVFGLAVVGGATLDQWVRSRRKP